jgi:hypothetical protein
VTDFLLNKCRWTVWQPPTSWRVKVDQVFSVTLNIVLLQEGFLPGEICVVKLRLGRKWVGAHHQIDDMTSGGTVDNKVQTLTVFNIHNVFLNLFRPQPT